jgi:hypothetical protein
MSLFICLAGTSQHLKLASLVKLNCLKILILDRLALSANYIACSKHMLGLGAFSYANKEFPLLVSSRPLHPKSIAKIVVVTLVKRPQ